MPYKKNDIGKRVAGSRRARGDEPDRGAARLIFDEDCASGSRERSTAIRPSGKYAAMANPPIHIIVEHGRVTLTGVVSSNVERDAGAIAGDGVRGETVGHAIPCATDARSQKSSRFRQGVDGDCPSPPLLIVHQISNPSSRIAAAKAPPNSQSVR